jgi:uncharacterized coiled-coil protein SlyX
VQAATGPGRPLSPFAETTLRGEPAVDPDELASSLIDDPEALAAFYQSALVRTYGPGLASSDPAEVEAAVYGLREGLEQQAAWDQGSILTPDGLITTEMMENATPFERSQYAAIVADQVQTQFGDDTEGARRQLRAIGLEDWLRTPSGGAGGDPNRTAQQDFENRLAELQARLAVDDITLDKASREVSRHLDTLAESRARADLTTRSLLDAAPFATGGKTSFSGSDLGGGISLLLNQAGIADPSRMSLLEYPTTLDIDPAALMAQGDAALGAQGQVPQIPALAATQGNVPARPTLTFGLPPQAPAGSAQAAPDLSGAPPIVSRISGLYTGEEGPL